jgi:hypothetical protein
MSSDQRRAFLEEKQRQTVKNPSSRPRTRVGGTEEAMKRANDIRGPPKMWSGQKRSHHIETLLHAD